MMEEQQPQQPTAEQTGETVTVHGHGYILGVPGTFAGEQVTLSADGTEVLARAALPPVAEAQPVEDTSPEGAQDTPEPTTSADVAQDVPPERRRAARVRTPVEATDVPPESTTT